MSPGLGRLATERERRERLGAEVDGEDLQHGQRQRDRPAGEREDEEGNDLRGRVGEDVEDELADVVEDPAPASTAATIVAKLSSVSTIVGGLARDVGARAPIATPMSARRSAGRR